VNAAVAGVAGEPKFSSTKTELRLGSFTADRRTI